MKVYLAGGMRGDDWQRSVIEQFPMVKYSGVTFFNPRRHGLDWADAYTTWDLTAIEHCDVVFAYLQSDNPSGVGMAAEIGYAKALGKKVILVMDEREDERYWLFVEHMADVVEVGMEPAIQVLQALCKII